MALFGPVLGVFLGYLCLYGLVLAFTGLLGLILPYFWLFLGPSMPDLNPITMPY